jgi:catechol 2,3-dioxygenase-like lactoylglutathione lyase family enzyme
MTLGDKNTAATVAVRDLGAAKRFYGDTLGL